MIRKWFKVKKMELELKHKALTSLSTILKEKENIIDLVKRLYETFGNMTVEELRSEFIKELASVIHEENQSNKDE